MCGGRCLGEGCGWKSDLAYLDWNNILKGLKNPDKEFEFDIAGHSLQSELYREARKVI